ncbi:MAG TPA: hypothetical protein PKD92_07540 [Novosphingobium sp.]|nr:hypothetical protein [Novosphingobium sp.]HMP56409.1 hypothetical protein [Novosphingobium sp.]
MPLFDPDFIFVIVVVATGGWLINNGIRARHGYPLEDEFGGKTELPANPRLLAELKAENEALRERLAHFEDRVQVLERIVTDSGYDTARHIEALRDSVKGA